MNYTSLPAQAGMMSWGSNWGPFGAGFSLFIIWSLVWKGLALWRSAKEDNRYWFIAFLVVHTGGLLELAYLFFFADNTLSLSTTPTKKTTKKKSTKK